MRIGIDMRMAGTGEGIGRYCEELVRHLAEIDHENEYFLISSSQFPIFNEFSRPNFHLVRVKSRYYSFMEQTYFIWELFNLRLDLMHFTSFNVPIFYPRRFIVTIHDVIHHRFPGRKKTRLLHRLAYRATIWLAAKRASKVIAVSETTAEDIRSVFGINKEKIAVIYEGAMAKTAEAGQNHHYEKPFLLFVGVWRQYKNLQIYTKKPRYLCCRHWLKVSDSLVLRRRLPVNRWQRRIFQCCARYSGKEQCISTLTTSRIWQKRSLICGSMKIRRRCWRIKASRTPSVLTGKIRLCKPERCMKEQ